MNTTIKSGTTLQKKNGEWHTFVADAEFTAKIDQKTYSTVYVVKSGPDRGTYRPRGL